MFSRYITKSCVEIARLRCMTFRASNISQLDNGESFGKRLILVL